MSDLKPAPEQFAWTDPVKLRLRSGPARGMTLFEAIYTLTFADDRLRGDGRVDCASGRFSLKAAEVAAICGRTQPSRAKPRHGHEANALILDGGPGGLRIEPVFGGDWRHACKRIWLSAPDKRAKGYVVSHDTVYDPAWLQRNRPSGWQLLKLHLPGRH